uniref:Uncharacterized protein n=1 Tax=Ananas comosus var. bracteatus TaxID=296719 RepID=A0A6V7PMK1_ANACO|nr:unnamed protein product [Ananas comosus var. bracteatus]
MVVLLSPPPPPPPPAASTRIVGGRHGISVRPSSSLPDPADTARAFRLLAAVHAEQRRRLLPTPRPLLVVTPTIPRPSQFPLLSSLAHSLLLLPFPLTWLLVEPPSPPPPPSPSPSPSRFSLASPSASSPSDSPAPPHQCRRIPHAPPRPQSN